MNKGNKDHGESMKNQVNDADKMREKQRKADLKKQGIVEEEVVEKKKEFNTDFMK